MKLTDALRIRAQMEALADSLPDDKAATVPFMSKVWSPDGTYAIGDRRQYKDKLYKCVQAHSANNDPTREPDLAVSLWAEVLPGQDGEIGEWVQPDSTNPYMKGDRVTHNGKTWESDIDYNVYEPGVAGWSEITV